MAARRSSGVDAEVVNANKPSTMEFTSIFWSVLAAIGLTRGKGVYAPSGVLPTGVDIFPSLRTGWFVSVR